MTPSGGVFINFINAADPTDLKLCDREPWLEKWGNIHIRELFRTFGFQKSAAKFLHIKRLLTLRVSRVPKVANNLLRSSPVWRVASRPWYRRSKSVLMDKSAGERPCPRWCCCCCDHSRFGVLPVGFDHSVSHCTLEIVFNEALQIVIVRAMLCRIRDGVLKEGHEVDGLHGSSFDIPKKAKGHQNFRTKNSSPEAACIQEPVAAAHRWNTPCRWIGMPVVQEECSKHSLL